MTNNFEHLEEVYEDLMWMLFPNSLDLRQDIDSCANPEELIIQFVLDFNKDKFVVKIFNVM